MEQINFAPAPAIQEAEEAQRSFFSAQRLTAGVLVAGLAVAGCGGKGNNNTAPVKTVEATAGTQSAANTDCGVTVSLGEHRADTVAGSPESLFPSLKTVTGGHEKLLPTEQAKEAIKRQLASDDRVLGIFTAFIMETRAKEQLPGNATLARAHDLIDSYQTNKELAAQHAAAACQAVEFLTPTSRFAVTKGQAVEVQAHHQGGKITAIDTQDVNALQNLSGFEVGFNDDDASLSPEQKAIAKKLQELILITDKGTLVINKLISNDSFKISDKQEAKPVRIVTKGGKVFHVRPKSSGLVPVGSRPHQTGQAPTSSHPKNNNGAQTSTGHPNKAGNGNVTIPTTAHRRPGGSGGGGGVSPGKTPEQQNGPANGTGPAGTAPEAAPNGTDQTPAGGGNQAPAPAPAPAPAGGGNQAPAPAPAPAPQPQPQPQPAPQPPKGNPAPCVSNPPFVICP